MNTLQDTWTRKLALVLIICAVLGTEISYHFTLESRFENLEEKLAQQSTSLQAMQESLDTIESSKNETLSGLNKQIGTLQSSFEPLGKMSQAQADTLNQLHEQLATLQKAQSDQQDAQTKLSTYLTQLELAVKKARADAAASVKPTPPPALPLPATNAAVNLPVSVPLPATNATSDLMSSPGAVSHPVDHAISDPIHSEALPELTPPRAEAVMDLRPADVPPVAPAAPAAQTALTAAPRALPIGVGAFPSK